MRWTRQRFAREGIAGRVERPVSDQQHADERCCCGRRSRVVLTPRRWRQVRGVASAQPGLDKTYPWTTVAKEPGHPAFPTPSLGRKINAQLGRFASRGRETAFGRHCERSEAIHGCNKKKDGL